MARSSRTSQAFTLIELLISVAILGVVSIYMFESFAVNQRAYTVIDQVSETQQSLRAIADLLERDIRHTGLMVPEGAAACGIDSTSAPDTLYLTDAAALDPGEDVATYDGAVVVGAVTNVSTGSNALTLSSLVIEPAPARPSYDMNGDGTADSDFRVDGGAIVLDLNNPARGTACGRITAINVGSSLVTVSIVTAPARPSYVMNGDGTADSDFRVDGGAIVLDLNNPARGTACGRVTAINVGSSLVTVSIVTAPLAAAGGTTRLVVIPAHEYRIQNADQLMRDGVLLSEGVEDLQVAWFFDLDGDNAIDANEVLGNGTNGNYAAAGRDAGQIRELRVNVVTRTRLEDREWTQGRIQATENRGAGVVDDGFRRRVHTTTVMLRNVGARNVT